MTMGKVVISQFISLDGVVEDPGEAEGFGRGGWAFNFDHGSEGDKFKVDEVTASEALLLGRETYEEFASAWSSRLGDFADRIAAPSSADAQLRLQDPLGVPFVRYLEPNRTAIALDIDGHVAHICTPYVGLLEPAQVGVEHRVKAVRAARRPCGITPDTHSS